MLAAYVKQQIHLKLATKHQAVAVHDNFIRALLTQLLYVLCIQVETAAMPTQAGDITSSKMPKQAPESCAIM